MTSRNRVRIAFIACPLVALSLAAGPALAAQRTFVASTGNDAFPCSLAQPCRSFAAAIAQTNAGGEIVVIDSAGYGPVTIAKSVTIVAPGGVHAGVSVSSGDGIIVNASGIEVTLRGLAITGQGGDNGIRFLAGASLLIDRCTVSGMSSSGIVSDSSGSLRVLDTVVNGNFSGIRANAGDLTLTRVQSEGNNGRGVDLGNGSTAISGGSFSHNGSEGISIHNVPSVTTIVAIEGATISHNADDGIGVFSANASGLASVTVSNSAVSANGGNGLSVVGTVNGGPARLYATDNTIANNAQDGISAGNNTGSTTFMSATRNLIAENGTGGIRVSNSGTIGVADGNTLVRNQGFGLTEGVSSTLYTRSNNTSSGNTSGNTFGSPTSLTGI